MKLLATVHTSWAPAGQLACSLAYTFSTITLAYTQNHEPSLARPDPFRAAAIGNYKRCTILGSGKVHDHKIFWHIIGDDWYKDKSKTNVSLHLTLFRIGNLCLLFCNSINCVWVFLYSTAFVKNTAAKPPWVDALNPHRSSKARPFVIRLLFRLEDRVSPIYTHQPQGIADFFFFFLIRKLFHTLVAQHL